jgi:17beta-estradiol 17-dehydrogenase / very-long-chain 3-oxoacyl-CoA reductase
VYTHFVCKKFDAEKYGSKNGGWALVTGASDGIGKGFVEELASLGFNLILVSRTESKLKDLSESIANQYKVQTKYVAVDAGDAQSVNSNLNKIKEVVQTVPLRILVNNVGTNTSIPVEFLEMTEEEIDSQLTCNVVFTTKLTKVCLPFLTKNNPSALINLSSITGLFPSSPFMSVYAATKSYDLIFSNSIQPELKRFGCDVIAVTPSFVASQMSGFKKTNNFVTSPLQTAKDTLSKLGIFSHVTPFWSHDILRIVSEYVPEKISVFLYYKQMKSTRERLLRKKS